MARISLFFWHGFHGLHGFFSFGGIQLRPFGYMPRHLKRGITGRNITVMVRRIDTYQGFKSQLPKGLILWGQASLIVVIWHLISGVGFLSSLS